MKAYLKKMSYRIGCACCNINKGLHHFRPKHGKPSIGTQAAKRAGKKQARQAGKKETAE